MSKSEQQNVNPTEERAQQGTGRQGTGHDERIAPQAPRGQETSAPSSVDSKLPVGHIRHVVVVTLAVLVLLAACACGVFACSVAAQDPMPIGGAQASDDAANAEGSADGGADADAAAEEAEGDETAAKGKDGKAKGKKDSSSKPKKDKSSKASKKNKSSKDGAAAEQGASSSGGASASSSSKKNNANNNDGSGKHNSSTSNKIIVSMTIDGSRAGDQDSASIAARKISVKRGANVFDVLVASGVSYSGDSTYVRSISGLAEFQCGSGSGWMYSVDGVFPNVSCGKYELSGGEKIVWAYTLDLGEDVK